ncbi:MAG: PAS domain S-box protein [Chloroflexi bacterium]|nr:PAS domain S-box protein [Chloroflexota bacterium]
MFTNAAGGPLGILAGARDITDQKLLEQQLRDQQFYTRSLIESNIDALMTTDPLGIITDVNQQMEALTGYSREELIGSAFKQYFTDPSRAEAGIKLVLSQGRVTNYELTATSKTHRETVVSYNATTFYDREGKLQGVFAAARDVTDRKGFEQALQQTNVELENAILAKDRFLTSMSHELRTPLNAITGFTGALLMKLAGPLTEDQEKQLYTIRTSASHLLSLINDLLDLAKIESGKVQVKLEPVELSSVIHEVVNTLKPMAEQKGLKFSAEVPLEPIHVRTDRRAVSQILLNLTNNAIKFTQQGLVSLELNRHQEDGRSRTEVCVIDTGVGIREEDQKKLFAAFSQLEQGPLHPREGTGLGLHLSKKLAELIGGDIYFESQFGKGSIFKLVLK